MNNTSVGSWMRGFFPCYILVMTLLRIVFLNVAELLPKEGQLLPRGGTWRPATQADRILSFIWFSFCWYFGALLAFGLMWRVGEVVYDLVFGDDS